MNQLPPKTYHDGKQGYWFKMAFPTYEWNVGSRKGQGKVVTAHADPCMVHVRHVDHPMDRPYYVTPRHSWAMVTDDEGNENKIVVPNRVFRFYPPRMPGQGRESGRHFKEMKMDDQGYYIAEPNSGEQKGSRQLTKKEQFWKENPMVQRGVNANGTPGRWEMVTYRGFPAAELREPYKFVDGGKTFVRLPNNDPRHSVHFEPKKIFIPDRPPGTPYKWIFIDSSKYFNHTAECMMGSFGDRQVRVERNVKELCPIPYKFKYFPRMEDPNQRFDPSMTAAEK